jgi:hypothetical protein
MNAIDAWGLRQNGWKLPVPKECTGRIDEIAKRQEELMDEHEDLDRELKSLAEAE